jgi:hypothetical protein
MFHKEQKGSLDADKLRAFGLTKGRMKDWDALLFYQLLFPIGDPKRSGVEQDKTNTILHWHHQLHQFVWRFFQVRDGWHLRP